MMSPTPVPIVNKDESLKIESAPEVGDLHDHTEVERVRSLYRTYLIGSCVASFVAGGVLIFAIFYFKGSDTETDIASVQTSSPISTPETIIKFDRSKITFEVLNASETSGVAKKAADRLQSLGYKIGDIGNDEVLLGSQLYISSDLKGFESQILLDLKEFSISKTSSLEGNFQAKIVIGK